MAGMSVEAVWLDCRRAFRAMRRSGTAWLAVATIGIGAGALTAVVGATGRILFRPLPYAYGDRLVWFGVKAPINPSEFLLEGSYWTFRQRQTVFDEMTSFSRAGECDLNERSPERIRCGGVAASFLRTFEIKPLIGRDFTAAEDTRNGPFAAILTYGLWQRRFGADPRVLGRTVRIDGRAAEIIGVLPKDFEMPNLAPVDVLVPQQLNIAPHISGNFLMVFGRLKPGVSVAAAQAALMPVYQETLEDVPPPFRKEISFSVTALRDRQVRDHRLAAQALFGCACAVLLIACANVGSLLLARSVSRRREIAVRAALGAGRLQLARESLIETLLIGAAGGVAGIGVALALMATMRAVASDALAGAWSSPMDWRVFSFALFAAVACGLAAGLAPALERPDPEELKRARTTGGRVRVRLALVAAQLALSVALLTGAGLLAQSLWNLQRTPLGFQPEGVVVSAVQLPETYSEPARRGALFDRVLERAGAIPGASAVALSDSVPLSGPATAIISNNMVVEGHPPADPKAGTGGMVINRNVTPGYFGAMGIRILRGRAFEDSDRNNPEAAVVLGESLARRLFGAEDPIGRRFRPFAQSSEWRRVVGIAADAKNSSIAGKDDPEFYTVWRAGEDRRSRRAYVLIRTTASLNVTADYLRRLVADIDPTIPVTVATLQQNIGKQLGRPRFQAWLLGSFALLGLALSAIGQFGAIATMVFNRSGEIGIRMALGSTPGQAARLIASSAARWVAAGAMVGLALAWWTSRLVASLLYGVKSADTWSFAAALGIAIGVSVAASWAPARRAARVDPAALLRRE